MKWYKIPYNIQTDQPFLKRIKLGDRTVCLVGYEGKVHALSAFCPHAGADLAQGWCKDEQLICPIHRYSYNINTGKGAPGQNDYIDVFPVEQKADGLYVGFAGLWERLKGGFK